MDKKAKPQFSPMDRVTYHPNGQIATILSDIGFHRTITQYDEQGNATISQDLGRDDVVNFVNGYISSIVKYEQGRALSSPGRTTIQYGPNGKILASVHESKIESGRGIRNHKVMWVTTSKTTYYDNGKIATHTTYQQRHDKVLHERQSDRLTLDDEAATITVDSYIASIEQMDESGKLILSVQLHEFDEVNYHPTGRIASILRKDKDNNPKTMVSYDENGKVLNQLVYQDGRVISSTDYTDGKPTSNVQQGNEEFQNIFERAKTRVEDKISETPDTALPHQTKERD